MNGLEKNKAKPVEVDKTARKMSLVLKLQRSAVHMLARSLHLKRSQPWLAEA